MPDAELPVPFSTPLLDAIRTPIPGDAPAGVNMAYEADYLDLKTRVDAMGAATGGVDFQAIVDGARHILSDRSKDVSVACYLAFALPRTKGYAGLAEGVAAVRAVAETFWEDAFPPLKRMRARQSAVQFMAERLGAWAETERATPDDREALGHALAEAAALQTFTATAMGDEAPALGGLTRTLREALRLLPVPAPPPPAPLPADGPPSEEVVPSSIASGAPAQSAPPPSAPSASAGAAGATFATTGEAQAVVLRVAGFLREADPTDATARTLVRAVRWGAVVQAPPSENGRTKVQPPPPARRASLDALLAAGNHALLASTAEDLFPSPPFHFWLDLQRLAAGALAALGGPASGALAAVTDATSALVRRLPALPTLSFADGTPFADPLTTAWLSEITASGGGEPATESPLLAALRETRAQASAGDVPGAVAALVAGAGAPRDRFERTVAAAEMCLGTGRPDVALGLLDDADAAVRAHRLDVWDPDTAARALRVLHTCCVMLQKAPASPAHSATLAERAADVFNRLTRLDPAYALRSTPAAHK